MNLQTKKCKLKGKGDQKEKQAEVANRETKEDLLQKTGKLKTRRVQPLKKQDRKKPSQTNTTYHVLSVVASRFLNNPEKHFYQLFCECKSFSSSRNIF